MAQLLNGLLIITTGLFTGLMMTLVFIMQKYWNQMEKENYVSSFKAFLIIAKGNPLITVLTLYSFVYPIIYGIIYIQENGLIPLTAGLIFFFGCFIVTMKLNFPIYNKVIEWNNSKDATDYEKVRKKFFFLNIVRLISSSATFVLLLYYYLR